MAWNGVITQIVTQPDLTAALSNHYTKTESDSALANKVSSTDGSAANLTLTTVGAGATAAISRAVLDAEVDAIEATLAGKANLTGAAFSGPVTVPTATAPTNPVRLEQLGTYLEKSGGTITGPILYGAAPTDAAHLTNKSYVDLVVGLKADLTYVDAQLATKATTTSVNLKANKAGDTFTGPVYMPSPLAEDESDLAATTSWVAGHVSTKLSLKANLDSPAFTGTPTAPTLSTLNESNKLATTAWVRQLIRDSGILPSLPIGEA